jgi:hypothetical protein
MLLIRLSLFSAFFPGKNHFSSNTQFDHRNPLQFQNRENHLLLTKWCELNRPSSFCRDSNQAFSPFLALPAFSYIPPFK